MSQRKKWWIFEALQWLVLAAVVAIVPQMSWWRYALLGGTFSAFAQLYLKQRQL